MPFHRNVFLLFSLLACTSTTCVHSQKATAQTTSSSSELRSPELGHHRKLLEDTYADDDSSSFLTNEYIVKLSDKSPSVRGGGGIATVQTAIQSLMKTAGVADTAEILYTYNHVFKGAAIRGLPRSNLISILSDDMIDYAAPNKLIRLSQTISTQTVSQVKPVWGLDRIDQWKYPLNEAYKYNYTGTNVTVFVMDTGISATHSEFKGKWGSSRVSCGFNAIKKETCTDLQGHGTHVSGTVGGLKYGVAKNVKLVNVKILNATGSGTISGIIAGLDYIVAEKKKAPKKPMVINMSVGSSKYAPLDAAVNAAVTAGIFVAVSAGNDSIDACLASPAGATKAMTVGSTDYDDGSYFDDFWGFDDDIFGGGEPSDAISYFSNYGKCVDIFAPGSSIVSADMSCTTCSIALDGTSMASPHVAGVAALYLERNNTMTPADIVTAMKAAATKNLIEGLDSASPNLLLRVNIPKLK